MKRTLSLILACTLVLGMLMPPAWAAETTGVTETETAVVVEWENYTIQIEKDGFRYGFYRPDGTVIVDAHQESGICFGPAGGTSYPVVSSQYLGTEGDTVSFLVTNSQGAQADVKLHLADRYVNFEIIPKAQEDGEVQTLAVPAEPLAEDSESRSLLVKGSGDPNAATVWKLNTEGIDGFPAGDYVVEASVKLPEGGTRSAGIYTHFNAENAFHLLFIKDGSVMLKRLNEDGSSVDTFETINPVDIQPGQWYDLKLVCEGKNIKGYVDDVLVVDVTDEEATDAQVTGAPGLRADKMDAWFDNFRVTSLDGQTVYYENDFETDSADQVKEDFTWVMGAQNLELTQLTPEPSAYWLELTGSPSGLMTAGEPEWTNYTVTAQTSFKSGDELTEHGLVFGYQDKDNYYGFRFAAQETMELYKLEAGAEAVLDSETLAYSFDKTYTLAAEVKDGTITCSVDGQALLTAQDSTFAAGQAGIRTVDTTSRIDSFAVAGSDGQTLFEADFSGGELEDAWTVVSGTAQVTDGTEEPEPEPEPGKQYYVIDARLAGGIEYMYGLGDYGAHTNTGMGVRETSNVVGVNRLNAGDFTNKNSTARFISNFSVAPQLGFAQVLFETDDKRVAITDDQTLLGACKTEKVDGLYYFFGTMEEIYGDYKAVRNAAGYQDTKPHYEMFGLGWEAFGSLGWNAYQSSVIDTLTDYLESGYDLTWGVIGSGFWTGDRKALEGTTTSFGMWDDTADPNGRGDGLPNPRFPDPDALKQFFQDNDMKLLLGIRNHLKLPEEYGGKWDPAVDGYFVNEALENGYFVKNDDGSVYAVNSKYPTGGIDRGTVGLIDGDNPEAVKWFSDHADLWGVDGWKEDNMTNSPSHHDDNWNGLLAYMAEEKDDLIIVRNASYCLPGDVLRINDANYGTSNSSFNNSPDRMVINALAYAASGQSNVYPDIIGGTGANVHDPNQQNYIVRNAYMAALCPSQSVGVNVLNMDNQEMKDAAFKAINWHSTYAPYIYDAALKSYETGYPLSMTPLYIAYPDDENTYDMINSEKRMFQWMLGESVLAAPLFGTDHTTATSRDVYLPEGRWIQYDTGEVFEGPLLLEDWESPIDMMPAFIGGKGVLIGEDMENKDHYFAEVFPVAGKGSVYEYTFIDGETTSTITNNNDGWAVAALEVYDLTAKESVDFTYNEVNGSIKFPFTAGHSYELRGGEGTGALATATIQAEQTSLWVGETTGTTLKARLDDGSVADLAGAEIVYRSSSPETAEVDESGVITAKAAGMTEITADITLPDRNGEPVTVTADPVVITVEPSSIQILSPAAEITEDFGGELSGWTDHLGAYSISDGVLTYDGNGGRGTIVTNAGIGTDYTIEADVTPRGLATGKTFGITFRYNDSNNNYLFVYTQDTGLRFLKRADNSLTQNVTIPYELEDNKTYHFKAVIQGEHFILYIDDAKVMDVEDNHASPVMTEGPCGLYTSGMAVEYDNVTIKSSVTAFPTVLSGTAQSGSQVRLAFDEYEAVLPLGRDGRWSYDIYYLPRGIHQATAQLLDGEGNVLAQTTADIAIETDGTPLDKEKLAQAVERAEKVSLGGMTEESVEAYEEALERARALLKGQGSQEELDAAAAALDAAVENLEPLDDGAYWLLLQNQKKAEQELEEYAAGLAQADDCVYVTARRAEALEDGEAAISRAYTVERIRVALEEAKAALDGVACPTAACTDIPAGVWYHDSADYMLSMGYMEGTGEGRFDGGMVLSRAQLAAILYRAAGSPEVKAESTFADVASGLWYSDAVAWAAENGVVTGGTDGMFQPDQAITREQLAVMLFRYEDGAAPTEDVLQSYPDWEQVSGYALEAMAWAVEQELIQGASAGGKTVLNPGGTATRAECAQILTRFLDRTAEK